MLPSIKSSKLPCDQECCATPVQTHTCFIFFSLQIREGPRKEIQDALKAGEGRIGIKYNFPDVGGFGGNSTTGHEARKFFRSRELRERMVEMYPGQGAEKDVFREFLENDSMIMRLAQCTRKLNVDKLEDLCQRQNLLIVNTWPWVKLTPSLHELYAHLPDLVRNNNDYGLGDLSEENLESLHRNFKDDRENFSRLFSVREMLKDTMKRQNTRSDPVVRIYAKSKRCQLCNSATHTKRKCPFKRNFYFSGLDPADLEFYQYLHEDNQPAWVKDIQNNQNYTVNDNESGTEEEDEDQAAEEEEQLSSQMSEASIHDNVSSQTTREEKTESSQTMAEQRACAWCRRFESEENPLTTCENCNSSSFCIFYDCARNAEKIHKLTFCKPLSEIQTNLVRRKLMRQQLERFEAFEKMCFERNLPLYWDEAEEDGAAHQRFENFQVETNGIISSFPE